ncbi:unnamed protein product, partial [Allacma fusca]
NFVCKVFQIEEIPQNINYSSAHYSKTSVLFQAWTSELGLGNAHA